MDYKFLLVFIIIILHDCLAQHENIPYEDVSRICDTCICLSAQDMDKRLHQTLNCASKNFKHILAHWPDEFGKNHNNIDVVAIFSGNHIELLQQLPATNATLTFACSQCGIKHLQAPTFMDVPNIKRLDLSWNEITTDELTPDVFRGPYRATRYEPTALLELDLSHNKLRRLDRKLFEHTPHLRKLILSHNQLNQLDNPTAMALGSASNLEELDLSYTGIKVLPSAVLKPLINLKALNLAGNQFVEVPVELQLVGKSLQLLNMAQNAILQLTEQSFLGLKVLRRLNISDMSTLSTVGKGTFTRLETLEYLFCARNAKLDSFDLDSLMHSNNLTQLDISYCAINTLKLSVDYTKVAANATLPPPWPRLRYFETIGNPWSCDCDLLQTLEFAGAHHRHKDTETRCYAPYIFSGARLSNLTAEQVCSMKIPKKYLVINEDPPRFLRKRYIILTLLTVAVVTVLGLLLGFVISCIRRRLKNDDFGVEPIRYTSVRSSNLSAFSHVQPHVNSSA